MVKGSTYLCHVLYALVALEISVSMYKMKHNPSHYNIKTHLIELQTFRNVQKIRTFTVNTYCRAPQDLLVVECCRTPA